MKNTKEKILDQLLLLQNATISQLSDRLGISEISVRHHLIVLEEEGLAASSEERHGVGRPRFIYHLTEKGYENAPANYLSLTEAAITTMKRVLGPEVLLDLFRQIGVDLAEGYKDAGTDFRNDHSLSNITSRLSQDGYYFSWNRTEDKYILTSHHCPFHKIVQKHPEVCTISQALLESLIHYPITHNTCVLLGDVACTYTFEVQ